MHIIACINYQDQGVFILNSHKEIWRVWIHWDNQLSIERCISFEIPKDVLNYFKNTLDSYCKS